MLLIACGFNIFESGATAEYNGVHDKILLRCIWTVNSVLK